MFIAVDFDGTIVEHEYPDIGKEVPGAIEWLLKWQSAGASLILWTMRCDSGPDGEVLEDAVQWCRDRGVEFAGHNRNPSQHWSQSPKAYASVYVDDNAFGCPLVVPDEGRPYVDWGIVGPAVMSRLEAKQKLGVRYDGS